MDRRGFLRDTGVATLGIGLGGCSLLRSSAAPRQRVHLVPVDVAWERIIRTTVGLRPYRESGFVVRAERLDDRMLIHNFGHGGAGMSLSWGTAQLASELALARPERQAAVIGCGVVGLTTARMLQRRGFGVTIYATALPPETTSNLSWGGFTPMSGIVQQDRRTGAWDAQFRRAVDIAYQELQLLTGRHFGVSWIDEYAPTNDPGMTNGQTRRATSPNPLLPASVDLERTVLGPGEHPFATRYARHRPTLRFEPSIYLDALMRDVLAFGGRIVVRGFDSPRDLMTLAEPLIVNCTGLGTKRLFGDDELTPVKGQLVVLVPQPRVNYIVAGMHPRGDGIVLGHTMQRDDWSVDVDESEQRRVIETHARLFASMRARPVVMPPAPSPAPVVPPVESFFDRVS